MNDITQDANCAKLRYELRNIVKNATEALELLEVHPANPAAEPIRVRTSMLEMFFRRIETHARGATAIFNYIQTNPNPTKNDLID